MGSAWPLWVLGLAVVAVLLLLVVLALRKPTPPPAAPELLARLHQLEQAMQALTVASTRSLAGTERMEQQWRVFTDVSGQAFEASRRTLDERLNATVAESRTARGELLAVFRDFELRQDQRQGAAQTQLGERVAALQATTAQSLESNRKELGDTLAAFRAELTATLKQLAAETQAAREALVANAAQAEQHIQQRFATLAAATQLTLDSLKADVGAQLGVVSVALKDQLQGNSGHIRQQFSALQQTVAEQLQALSQGSLHNAEQLRTALNERLAAIQADNTAKLEEMRRTVDEKLHATLEQRLGDSFKLVSERLEQVHAGLGEMKTLAGNVGDLKRVMTNVRTRGTWGEVQLGGIIESLLTAEQFGKNIKTVPGSNDLVEYAIKMPGKGEGDTVWLPIDAKYPVEDYQRLMDAHESGDKPAQLQAATAFESSIRFEAKKIATKYLSPPHTTDFAILFVPTEGLFAEVCRIPGMVEALQNEHRVVIAGPTTLAAMLNSLRLGFRTLAIEKRSSEVWGILAGVKTEFKKFGDIVEATKKSIDQAANKFNDIGVRTRAIERKLRDVHDLPSEAATPGLLAAGVLAVDDEGLGEA